MGYVTAIDGDEVTELRWQAPTENENGTPITQAINYRLYSNDQPVLSFPGTLNQDGSYGFPLAQVPAIAPQGAYVLELTAIDEDGDESARSNNVTVLSVVGPKPPLGLSLI